MEGRISAPWTMEEVDGLNRWQAASHVHPFTHDCGSVMIATVSGWICPDIGCKVYDCADASFPMVVQKWAHDFMAHGPGPNPLDMLLATLTPKEPHE